MVGIDIRRSGQFGIGTYLKNLLQSLQRVGPENRYVLIGSRTHLDALDELGPNFRFEPFPYRFDSRRSHLTFRFLLRRLGLDVFHMPHRWIPYWMPEKYIVTLHDINNILFPAEDCSPTRLRLRKYMTRHGLNHAARIIAVSEATKQAAIQHLGIEPAKIDVIHDALDEQVAQPVTDEERHRTLARYQVHDPFVLYAGRIQVHKNIPRLIEAFAVVRSELANHWKFHNLRLIVIGDALDDFPEVRHTVLRTRVQEWVRFLGFVPVETLRVFYDAATAFVFPSLYEGFGLPPLESMSHGTPVVTSNVSSLPEAVGDAAELVDPENVFDIARGLRKVLLDDAYREDLRRRGFEQVRRFSWDRTAEKVLQVYREVAVQR